MAHLAPVGDELLSFDEIVQWHELDLAAQTYVRKLLRYQVVGWRYQVGNLYRAADVEAAITRDQAGEQAADKRVDLGPTEPCPFCGEETLRLWFVDSCQVCGAELDTITTDRAA